MSALAPLNPKIFHITHVDNLPGILRAGGLWSDEQRIRQGLVTLNIGYRHIKERRLRRPVPVAAGGTLGQYVPFNFCCRSVMLYRVHKGHPDYAGGGNDIVHLVSSVQSAQATGRPWAFTDIHADLAYAAYYDEPRDLVQVDWNVMPPSVFWGGDDQLRAKRQAEFLVYDFFPWTAVESLCVHDEAMAQRVRSLVERAVHRPPVNVEPGWYYDS